MKRYGHFFLTVALLSLTASHVFTASSQTGQSKPSGSRSSQDKTRNLIHKKDPADASTVARQEDAFSGQSFALLIGISKYKNLPAQAQLQFADEDARALHSFLTGPRGGFRTENVTLIVNEQATYQEILRSLEQLQNRAGPRDLVLIFFAGHGIVNLSNQGFLLANDSNPEDLLVTAVEMDRFNSVLKNIRARSAVVLSDACHSGAIGDLISNQTKDSVKNITARSFTDPSGRSDQSAFIFSAASPSQSSWEMKSLGHGLFTHHVIEGLNGKADRNSDGLINAKELYDYTATQVQQDAEREGRSQVPEFNPQYDYTIPLSFLNESGLKLYQAWFDSDPFITRYTALFEEALNTNRLTKPENESAWDYYNFLKLSPRTPPEKVKETREALLAKLQTNAQAVIDSSPADPGQWEEAAGWFEKAHELSRDKALRPRQTFCSAMAAHHAGENGRAERECDTAITLIEEGRLKDPVVCLRIAQFYKKIERWEKARRGFSLALEADSRVDWVVEYAEVLLQLNDLGEAEAQLQRARSLDPNHTRGLRLLTDVLLRSDKKEKFSEAVEIAARARSLNPDDMGIEEVYGWALLKNGQPQQAIEPLRRVAQLRITDDRLRDTALLRLSQAYAQSGDRDRSISALREAETRGSRRAEIFDEMSRLLEEKGDIDSALAAAEKGAALTDGQEKSRRLSQVAEQMERAGRLAQAALKYREAGRLATDGQASTSLENHARVLFFRAGRPQDAGLSSKRSGASRKVMSSIGGLLIVPGGREALSRLTGIHIDPADEGGALATIFDACLRDSSTHARLISFHEKYPQLVSRIINKGARLNERLDLPSSDKPASEAAREAMRFFGVMEKGGRREINRKEFDLKKQMFEALGGDATRLERGEATQIVLKNDDFSVLLGMQRWALWIRDGAGARPENLILQFLRDPFSMRLYAGFSRLSEEQAERVMNFSTRETSRDTPAAIYFAAPFLRFTPEGNLHIPGQRQGELNWQRVMKANGPELAVQSMLRRDSGKALYYFAALSAAGQVGDLIASSHLFDKFFFVLKDSPTPASREPFDLMDLFLLMRVEKGKLRLPRPVEVWLGAEQKDFDPAMAIASKIEKAMPGKQIAIVRQIAALDAIERERADWLTDQKTIEFIARLVREGREAQIETALDLQMDWKQAESYFAQIARIDAISTPPLKQSATRIFQSAFEILRITARRGAQSRQRTNEMVNRLLELDPGSERFAFDLVVFLRNNLLGLESSDGREVEDKLIELLSGAGSYVLNSGGGQRESAFVEFDRSRSDRQRIAQSLGTLSHTRLKSVINAFVALDGLEKSPADAVERLKTAAAEFIEPEPEPPPKKGKPKQPVVRPPTLKETVSQLTAPVDESAALNLRNRIAPFLGEALLGALYAAIIPAGQPSSDMVRRHNLTDAPWGEARYDEASKSVRGAVARLSYAMAERESRLPDQPSEASPDQPDSQLVKAIAPKEMAALTTTLLNSFELADQRLVTARAQEYVARSIDMGEDVFGLYLLGEQSARDVVDRLEEILSARRAQAVRYWLDQGEAGKAISSASVSELCFIGQRYFRARLEADGISALAVAPGALGAMARSLASKQDAPDELIREMRQFGVTTASRSGLMRLDLRESESYEEALSFDDSRRLAERFLDLKLAIARLCHRRGHPASLSLDSQLARSVIEKAMVEVRKNTGRTPPDRDWQDLLAALQSMDEGSLAVFVNRMIESKHARALKPARWDDEIARAK
jgi:tetratricopeptide (TPR) repeat protein